MYSSIIEQRGEWYMTHDDHQTKSGTDDQCSSRLWVEQIARFKSLGI